MTDEAGGGAMSEHPVEQAMKRATSQVADDGDGWETTAAVLAYEGEATTSTGGGAMTLTDFLLARTVEREAMAREAWAAAEHDTSDHGWRITFLAAEVLAECEAKRRIVARYVDTSYIDPAPSNAYDLALFHVMCDLALPYADHPDYREEWRP